MAAGGLAFLRRDRAARGGAGGADSGSSILGLFARLEGAVRTGSGGDSGLVTRAEALRFKEAGGGWLAPDTLLEVAVAVAAAAELSAASLAAERVTLEDMRTSSVLSGRQCPSAWTNVDKGG